MESILLDFRTHVLYNDCMFSHLKVLATLQFESYLKYFHGLVRSRVTTRAAAGRVAGKYSKSKPQLKGFFNFGGVEPESFRARILVKKHLIARNTIGYSGNKYFAESL